jgi:hypothetical protein
LPFATEIQGQDALNNLRNVRPDPTPARRSSTGSNTLQSHLENALNTKFSGVMQSHSSGYRNDPDSD